MSILNKEKSCRIFYIYIYIYKFNARKDKFMDKVPVNTVDEQHVLDILEAAESDYDSD